MQINRLFEIVYILTYKKEIKAKELAKHFEVSTRTIYRDIDKLLEVGIPIYTNKGKGGGIYILDNYVLNKSLLTESEKTDILSSLNALKTTEYGDSSTLEKISSFFGKDNIDWIEIDFSLYNSAKKDIELFEKIKQAIISKRVVKFSYFNLKGIETIREIEPLRLYFRGLSMYMYGYCKLRKDFRFFKLSRIKNFNQTDEIFIRKGIYGSLKSETEDDKDTEYINVKLKFSPKMQHIVYDEYDSFEKDDEGYFIVEKLYKKNDFLFSFIMSFGNFCEVLEPESLRNSIKEELQKTIKKYL